METNASNNHFSLFLVRIFVSACGVKLENDPLRFLNHYILIFSFNLLVVITLLMKLYYSDDTYVTSIICYNLIHCSNYIITWIFIYLKQDTLKLILETVRNGIHHYPPFMQPYLVPQRSRSILLKVLFYSANLSFLTILIIPMTYLIIDDRIPNVGNLIYPAWYPWNVDTKTSYFLTYFLQLVLGIPTAGYMPLNILFVMYFVLVVQDQKTSLIGVTKNVIQNYEFSQGHYWQGYKQWNEDSEDAHRLKNAIIECVKHHCSILRFINYFVSSYKWIFILNLVYSTAVFTLNCYLLISSDYYLPKFTQRICELLLVFPYLFVYCYIGEVFKEVNNAFRATMYEINWYEKPVKLQKSILFLLTSTSKEITLNFSVNLVASYTLFASIIRASYTYANILINTRK